MQLHELQLKALNGRAATPPPQEAPSQQTPTTSNGMSQFFAIPALPYYQPECFTMQHPITVLSTSTHQWVTFYTVVLSTPTMTFWVLTVWNA